MAKKYTGGPALREALQKFGLKTAQINEALKHLKGGGDFKSLKGILRKQGFDGLGDLRGAVNTYLSTGSPAPAATPTPTIQTIGPLAPGVESIPTTPAFEGVNPYTGLLPAPTPTPLYPNIVEDFPTISGTPDPANTGPGGTPLSPTYIDTIKPPEEEPYNPFDNFPEFPDFEAFMADQAALMEQMMADAEKERLAAEAAAAAGQRTAMGNMAQGSQIADFRAGSTPRNYGGTAPFKRRGVGRMQINPMVNRALSLAGGINGGNNMSRRTR